MAQSAGREFQEAYKTIKRNPEKDEFAFMITWWHNDARDVRVPGSLWKNNDHPFAARQSKDKPIEGSRSIGVGWCDNAHRNDKDVRGSLKVEAAICEKPEIDVRYEGKNPTHCRDDHPVFFDDKYERSC